jgi:hypothetical protein
VCPGFPVSSNEFLDGIKRVRTYVGEDVPGIFKFGIKWK